MPRAQVDQPGRIVVRLAGEQVVVPRDLVALPGHYLTERVVHVLRFYNAGGVRDRSDAAERVVEVVELAVPVGIAVPAPADLQQVLAVGVLRGGAACFLLY